MIRNENCVTISRWVRHPYAIMGGGVFYDVNRRLAFIDFLEIGYSILTPQELDHLYKNLKFYYDV